MLKTALTITAGLALSLGFSPALAASSGPVPAKIALKDSVGDVVKNGSYAGSVASADLKSVVIKGSGTTFTVTTRTDAKVPKNRTLLVGSLAEAPSGSDYFNTASSVTNKNGKLVFKVNPNSGDCKFIKGNAKVVTGGDLVITETYSSTCAKAMAGATDYVVVSFASLALAKTPTQPVSNDNIIKQFG